MKIGLIARAECMSLLRTPTGWLVMAGVWFICGLMWSLSVFAYAATLADQVFDPYAIERLTLVDWLLGPWWGNLSVVLVFVTPVLTMRSIAGERASGTLELLKTSPVTSIEIVVGKFVGVWAFQGLMLVGTLHAPIGLAFLGAPAWGAVGVAYMTLWCFAGALTALGLMCSSVTRSQVLAASATFAIGLTAYLVGVFDAGDPTAWHVQLSMSTHLIDGLRGALRLSDVVYFVGLSAVCLCAAWQRLESERWA